MSAFWQRPGLGTRTVERDDERNNPLGDPGSDLADVRDQGSIIHETVEDFLCRHLGEMPGCGTVVLDK